MTRDKIARMRSVKTLEQTREKLLNALHGNWIEWVGYDRAAHVEEIKTLVRFIDTKLKSLNKQ